MKWIQTLLKSYKTSYIENAIIKEKIPFIENSTIRGVCRDFLTGIYLFLYLFFTKFNIFMRKIDEEQ